MSKYVIDVLIAVNYSLADKSIHCKLTSFIYGMQLHYHVGVHDL